MKLLKSVAVGETPSTGKEGNMTRKRYVTTARRRALLRVAREAHGAAEAAARILTTDAAAIDDAIKHAAEAATDAEAIDALALDRDLAEVCRTLDKARTKLGELRGRREAAIEEIREG